MGSLKKSGIYQIQNLVNGKVYIGSSIDLELRKRTHFNKLNKNQHANAKLQHAFNFYSHKTFEFSVVEYVSNIYDLLKIEQYYIDIFDSVENGYNICPNATSTLGRPCLSETRLKISMALNANNPWLGKKHKEESKRKISLSNMGKPSFWKGKTQSAERNKKISDTKKKNPQPYRPMSQETKLKIIEKIKYSKEYIDKISVIYEIPEKPHKTFKNNIISKSMRGNQYAKGHKVSDELKQYYADLFKGEKSAKFGTHVSHCPQGHLMSGENLVIRPNGVRRCHACLLTQGAKRRATHRARKEAQNGTQ